MEPLNKQKNMNWKSMFNKITSTNPNIFQQKAKYIQFKIYKYSTP